jgi:histidine triad (HIT) family protein
MPVKGLGPYDDTNIFARILRGEIPSSRVYEDEFALAFHDINPQAPIHVLVIPKTQHVSIADFATNAPPETVAGFFRAVALVARQLDLEEPGYRILANMGRDAYQEVPHFHVHIFGGRPLGRMLTPPS